jgi:phosphocarrier protein FPr
VSAPVQPGEVLSRSAIVIGARAATKEEAIARAGGILVAEGNVEPAYVDAMGARESIISTYLGNGIALPHGTDEARAFVIRTGLAVVQYPDGVPWGDEPARLVLGLAATSEEHIPILARLATILDDEDLCARLASTTDAAEIHTALTAGTTSGADAAEDETDERAVTVRITNPAGLHARPAAEIVERLRTLGATVTIVAAGRRADARSITGLLGLGATVGDELTIMADGDDAQAAIDAVVAIATAAHEGSR